MNKSSVRPQKNPSFGKPLRARFSFNGFIRVGFFSGVWCFRWKTVKSACRTRARLTVMDSPSISIVDEVSYPRSRPNSHVIYRTHRNSCPTTVHPLRRLLSFRRNASATLSLSILDGMKFFAIALKTQTLRRQRRPRDRRFAARHARPR